MMKKTIITALFICLSTSIFSQSTSYFKAVYTTYYNTDVPQIRTALLHIDIKNKRSIFHLGKNKNIDKSSSKITTNDYGASYTIKYKDIESFIELNLNNGSIYSKENHRGKTYYVKDKVSNLNWNLNYSENKKIGTLLCKKATTHFRGRNYTAWYTTEIPINYGPYKFQGLPGLIASINDDSNTFIWILSSYKATKEKPSFVDKNKLKPQINAKEYYRKIRYPSDDEKLNRIQSKLPKGIKLISATSDTNIRKGIETKFEWEKDKKK